MPRKSDKEIKAQFDEELAELVDEVMNDELAKYLGELAKELDETKDVVTAKIKLDAVKRLVRGGKGA